MNKIIPGEACDGAKQQLCKDIWWYYFSDACNLFKPGLLPDELLGDAVQERIFFLAEALESDAGCWTKVVKGGEQGWG